MLTTNLIEKNARKALLTSIAVFVGYNLLNGLKGGIDNSAHIGGLVSGFIIGYAFIPSLKKPEQTKLKYSTISLLSLIVILSSFVIYKNIPNDIRTYEIKMKQFVSMESMALEVYHLPKETPNDELLKQLKDRGIYYWNENKKLIEEADKLNLPDEIHQRNMKLKKYCDLRLKTYEMTYKVIAGDTTIDKGEFENICKQINAVISELKEKQQPK
jgi:rhomboid protease GluP